MEKWGSFIHKDKSIIDKKKNHIRYLNGDITALIDLTENTIKVMNE